MTEPIARTFESAAGPLHYLDWPGDGPTIVLLHGLASNAWIWGAVAPRLSPEFRVVALDQRGHGRSAKPDSGYDFATICNDLREFLDHLGSPDPLLVGHSWGGNVTLQFAVDFPERCRRGLVWVDGGFISLRSRPNATWESTERDLAPPPLAGLTRDELVAMSKEWDYGEIWNANTERALLGCFAVDAEGRIAPNLSLANHLKILRALWDQTPENLYPGVDCPVLILPARRASEGPAQEFQVMKARGVKRAMECLPDGHVRWFEDTLHDVPLHRPAELAAEIAAFARSVVSRG